jgi:hypothetical protein
MNYNFMRSWPITFTTETGEVDRQSVQMMLLKKDLADNGYLNSYGYLNFNPAQDLFIFDGMVWKAVGDTAVSQVDGDDLIITIILKRQELSTADLSITIGGISPDTPILGKPKIIYYDNHVVNPIDLKRIIFLNGSERTVELSIMPATYKNQEFIVICEDNTFDVSINPAPGKIRGEDLLTMNKGEGFRIWSDGVDLILLP